MKTFWKILLYVLGFPLMTVLVFLASKQVMEYGESYGIMVYGGVIVSAVVTLLFVVVGLITWGISRKAKTRKAVRICTIVLVLFSFILTSGIWVTLDKVMPDILDDATSGTIDYDDVRESYNERAEYHRYLLDKFITMNCENGNLTQYTEEEYLAQGYRNEEVKELISQQFKSLDEDGYKTFDGYPWLSLALDGRMTIPVVVHLIVDERVESEYPFLFYGEGREGDDVTAPVKWTILDMAEPLDPIDLSGLLGNEGVAKILEMSIVKKMIDSNLPELLTAISNSIADESLAGAPIYVNLDLENAEVRIVPSAESRGVHDYMHMAWFNSNGLLFLVISLFPARNIFLFYSAIAVVLALAIGLIRERQYKANFKEVKEEAKAKKPEVQNEETTEKPRMAPYYEMYFDAKAESKKRLKY